MGKRGNMKSSTSVLGALAAGSALFVGVWGFQAAAASPAPTATVHPAVTAQATNDDLTTYVEPSAGFGMIYDAIDDAQSSIDLTMYELQDTTAEQDLAAAAARGVDVRVILSSSEESNNDAAYTYLQDNGVSVVWSSSAFTNTHQKTLTTDDDESWIMTANLQTQYYSTSRDFIVSDTDQNDVDAIVAVFNDDFTDTSITPSDGDDLVWSPGSQSALVDLIDSAQSSLLVENEEMGSSAIVDALCDQAENGVSVTVVMTDDDGTYDSEFSDLTNCGATVDLYPESASLYIHAKAIVADDDDAYVGSINFSSTSMDDNRELGLITTNSNVVSTVDSTITSDAANAPETYGSD